MPPVPVLRPDGPVLLFGGCYSNLEATNALLAEASRLGIPPGRIVCTGDVVAYCADAVATVQSIRAAGIHVVMGNCEESLGGYAEDCGCGFDPGTACDRLSAAWYAHADATLDADAREWMRGLPQRIDLIFGSRRLAVVHGSPERINEFVFASASDDELSRHIVSASCDGVIGGHCGIPFTRIVGGSLWHNPGAIGIPANDGTARVWFSVLEASDQSVRIRHHPLEYDHRASAMAMRQTNLPGEYAQALQSGLWPSLDVLPPMEFAQTGQALTLGTILWPNSDCLVRT